MTETEYPVRVKITSAGTYLIGINKAVRGVSATAAVDLGWDFNGEQSKIAAAVTEWMPTVEFRPAPTSKLIIVATVPTDVYIRMV